MRISKVVSPEASGKPVAAARRDEQESGGVKRS
ncbi:hypothetical protein KQS06HV_170076 [Klebsiella quasipneumoniae subsp. similipneumoniae]|nr:hypothetical protein KQS06HV_170076 [Klebsiella quasipneumoniae subsp. similipneumoniae]